MQKTFLALSMTIIVSVTMLKAQQNSIYSRFGLGDYSAGAFTEQTGMGGLYSAVSSRYLNYANPAALSKLEFTTFQVEGMGAVGWEKSKDSAAGAYGNAAPRSLAFGFVLARNKKLKLQPCIWGASIGVQSAGNINYNIYRNTPLLYEGTTSSISQQIQGTGGTYRFFMGHGVRMNLGKKTQLALGLRLDYMFGNMIYDNNVIYPDSLYSFSSHQKTYNNVSGFTPGAGFQLYTRLGKMSKHSLTVGANITAPSTPNVYQYTQWDRYISNTGSIRDTIYANNTTGHLHTPLSYAIGITWAYTDKDTSTQLPDINKWQVGIQYEAAHWQDYRFMGAPDSLGKSWKASIGVVYLPKYGYFEKYGANIKYRFGAYVGQSPVILQNTTIMNYGFTCGMGLPLRGMLSEVNWAMELGSQGTQSNGLVKETYIKLHFGFTFNDNSWFQHRKFQ